MTVDHVTIDHVTIDHVTIDHVAYNLLILPIYRAEVRHFINVDYTFIK